MNKFYIKFFQNTTIASVVLSLVLFLVIRFLPVLNVSYRHLFVVLFFYSSCLLFHFIIMKLAQKKVRMFTTYFMASTLIKIVLYSAVILLYIFNFKTDVKIFVVIFFITYIVFTVLEVISLQKFVRSIK